VEPPTFSEQCTHRETPQTHSTQKDDTSLSFDSHSSTQQGDTFPFNSYRSGTMPWNVTIAPSSKRAFPLERGHALCARMITRSVSRLRLRMSVCLPLPSPAPKITGLMMTTKALMLDEASLKAFSEAVTVESAAVAARRSPL
jgi:hypothetical protein